MEAEDLYALYRERQSDRKFADRPVPQEVLERILHNAMLAPSATNQQPWSIVAVSEPETVQRVGQAVIKGVTNMNKFALEAPAHLLIVAERGRCAPRGCLDLWGGSPHPSRGSPYALSSVHAPPR